MYHLRIAVFFLVFATSVAVKLGAQAGPPGDASTTEPIILSPAETSCKVDVSIETVGKGKQIDLPSGGGYIATSPALNATITNLVDTAKAVTLNITGVFHVTKSSDDSEVWRVTGRNLLWDPEAGFVLAIGNFTFAFGPTGDLVQPLSGQGTLTNVCALIDAD